MLGHCSVSALHNNRTFHRTNYVKFPPKAPLYEMYQNLLLPPKNLPVSVVIATLFKTKKVMSIKLKA